MAGANRSANDTTRIGRIALIAALIVAVIAIGIAVARNLTDKGTAEAVAAPSAPGTTPEQAIAGLEARLKANPQDVEGWQMLGWAFFETGRFAEAATAYRKAVALAPNTADLWSGLGEALVMASDTKAMPADAVSAFETAIVKDPKDPRARYFLAVNKDLSGNPTAAIEDWFALLKDTPAGAPWEADLRRTIEQVAAREKIDVSARLATTKTTPSQSVATAAIPGPTRDQMAAASGLPPGQQETMVRGMVDGLAQRLAANPRDAEGWIRLMRSRMVLGETSEARAALETGRKAFSGDPGTQRRLSAAARELGVPEG